MDWNVKEIMHCKYTTLSFLALKNGPLWLLLPNLLPICILRHLVHLGDKSHHGVFFGKHCVTKSLMSIHCQPASRPMITSHTWKIPGKRSSSQIQARFRWLHNEEGKVGGQGGCTYISNVIYIGRLYHHRLFLLGDQHSIHRKRRRKKEDEVNEK